MIRSFFSKKLGSDVWNAGEVCPVLRDLWVVSDLHITRDDDSTAQSFVQLVDFKVMPGDRLVLAGDLFDVFLGQKQIFIDRFESVISCLKRAASRGVFIDFIEGNHDLQLKKVVELIPNSRLKEPGVALSLSGVTCWIEHGDLANSSDWGYLLLRATLRSAALRLLVTVVPAPLVDRISRTASETSRNHHPVLPESLPATKLGELRKIYRAAASRILLGGADRVIFGHCHDQDEVIFRMGERQVQYINMGFPPVHGTILHWTPGDDRIRRVPFRHQAAHSG